MVNIDDYKEEKECQYKNEHYLVRDNGAVLRLPTQGGKKRRSDNEWTFGKLDIKTGYLNFCSERVHRIVATAFLGDAPTPEHVVDHIDTNRQNNRPSNLRWLTRFENVVYNPVTRKKIEFCCGVDIFEFLKNPEKYRECFSDPKFGWMRTVSESEAKQCLENMKKWTEEDKEFVGSGEIGEWIYKTRQGYITEKNFSVAQPHAITHSDSKWIDSLTPGAVQANWRIPSEFPCCPTTNTDNPLEAYIANLAEGKVFVTNKVYTSTIWKFEKSVDGKSIVILSNAGNTTPYALAVVTYEEGYFVHTSIRTFFTEDGAEKYYAIHRGLEWTGGDVLEDFC